jgi:4a-hydroxytetrahydrobiopterin dehydratase
MVLKEQNCEPCHAGTPKLSREESESMLKEIPGWTLKENSIEREFKFKDFGEAIDFINRVAEIADAEGHHPDIYNSYNVVNIELWTHKIGGLSGNDFIVAAKINEL